MKKVLTALIVGVPLFAMVGCTQEHIVKRQAPAEAPAEETPAEETPGEPDPTKDPAKPNPSNPNPSTKVEDTCLGEQDMNGADVDISACPALPAFPADVMLGKDKVSLGAWEIGTTKTGATYKYGTLSAPGTDPAAPRMLSYDGGEVEVNAQNVECWAKGYYRLRKILQNAPAEWLALKNAGFQYRFFQFQTDLRNGPTGYKAISSFQDHLVKWVTVVSKTGACEQPTLKKFVDYSKSELTRRGIAVPASN